MHPNLQRNLRRYFRRSTWRINLIFWGGAIIVGAVAAVFAQLSDAGDAFFRTLITDRPWLPFIITPAGLVLISWMTRSWFAGAEGSGIPQTLVALSHSRSTLCGQLMSLRVATGKFLLTVAGLFCGASIGRAGPTVHIGAALMYSFGRYARMPSRYFERGLILTGGGAGIAAAFNTPVAGIMFAIEELSRSFDRRYITMMIIGIGLAGMTAILVHQDNYNYYGDVSAGLGNNQVWLGVLLCGISGGLLGGIFSFVLVHGSRKLRPLMINHWVTVAVICGLVVATAGYISGGIVFGSGYIEGREMVTCAGSTSCVANIDAAYPFLKIIATAASYLSGVPAGIYAPSLSIGAGLGYDLAVLFPPDLLSTIVVLAMVGYFSGVVQTPITTFIIVMEMTNDNELVLAMMATSLLASGVSGLISRKSIYTELAENFMASRVLAEQSKQAG